MPLVQPYVSTPANGSNFPADSPSNPSTFVIALNTVPQLYSWKVEIGFSPGANDVYIGTEIIAPTNQDSNYKALPGGNTLCYCKIKYRKVQGGGWYSGGSTTTFTSTDQ
jgi:hypothetical protein